jgi:hypothetical protein
LRFTVAETNGTQANSTTYWLQARVNGGGYETITESSQVSVGFSYSPSPNVPNATPTTRQLSATPTNFQAGYVITANPTVKTTVPAGGGTEWEYCLLFDATNFSDGDIFDLRLVLDGNIPLDAYPQTARFTLSKPTYVYFSGSGIAAAGAASGAPDRDRYYTGQAQADASWTEAHLTWVGKMKAAVIAVADVFSILGIKRQFSGAASASSEASSLIKKFVFLGSAIASAITDVTAKLSRVKLLLAGLAAADSDSQADMTRNRFFTGTADASTIFQDAHLTWVGILKSAIVAESVATASLSKRISSSGHVQINFIGD